MVKPRLHHCYIALVLTACIASSTAFGQTGTDDESCGPVVRAYLGYLRNEQHVVDDRVSRREVNRDYYLRNSNRIRALRQMALRIADESGNDYLPELEAVAGDELGLLFEHPPKFQALKVGEVLWTKFRYLGRVKSSEVFYLFARLDPYEQAELIEKRLGSIEAARTPEGSNPILRTRDVTRARRVNNPQ